MCCDFFVVMGMATADHGVRMEWDGMAEYRQARHLLLFMHQVSDLGNYYSLLLH